MTYIVHKAVELSALSKAALAKIDEAVWVISPKYDGCHAIFLFDDGKHVMTVSRTGELVLSMGHIARDLLALYPISKGRIAICGEAWMVGKEFNEISGMFRRYAPQPELQFVPFDIVPFDYPMQLGQLDGVAYPTPYLDRLTLLANPLPVLQCSTAVVGPSYHITRGKSLDEALIFANGIARFHKKRTDNFYDGAVLSQGSGLYKVGSGKGGEFIKCKPLLSYSVKVTAVVSDIGPKTGKNTCVLMYELDSVIQKVSTGLTQQQADAFTNNPELIIDQTIEVEAMGLTVNGLLREPRFKGIRIDA